LTQVEDQTVAEAEADEALLAAAVAVHGQAQRLRLGVQLEGDLVLVLELDPHRSAPAAVKSELEAHLPVPRLLDAGAHCPLPRPKLLRGDDPSVRCTNWSATDPSATQKPTERSRRRPPRHTVSAKGRSVISTRASPRVRTRSSAIASTGTATWFSLARPSHPPFTERSQDVIAFFTAPGSHPRILWS